MGGSSSDRLVVWLRRIFGLATACWRCTRVNRYIALNLLLTHLGEGVVDGLDLVVIGERALQGHVSCKRVVVVQQLPFQQCSQLLAAVALVDALDTG